MTGRKHKSSVHADGHEDGDSKACSDGGPFVVCGASSSEENAAFLPWETWRLIYQGEAKSIAFSLLAFLAFLFVSVNLYNHLVICPLNQERWKHEEEERQKLNMFWGHVEPHTCTTYATREYTAQLMNLPATWEHRVEACKVTPLEVHGISYLPKSCEDKGPGVVIGKWEINRHEPDCAPFWIWYKDKGCTSPGSGKRRIEQYLENLPQGSDGREFCATTPARFHEMEFSGADHCTLSMWGVYGQWEIDDETC